MILEQSVDLHLGPDILFAVVTKLTPLFLMVAGLVEGAVFLWDREKLDEVFALLVLLAVYVQCIAALLE